MQHIEKEILDAESQAIAIGRKVIVVINAEGLDENQFAELAARFSCHCYHPFERVKSRNYYYFDFRSPFSDLVTIRVKHNKRFRREYKRIEI